MPSLEGTCMVWTWHHFGFHRLLCAALHAARKRNLYNGHPWNQSCAQLCKAKTSGDLFEAVQPRARRIVVPNLQLCPVNLQHLASLRPIFVCKLQRYRSVNRELPDGNRKQATTSFCSKWLMGFGGVMQLLHFYPTMLSSPSLRLHVPEFSATWTQGVSVSELGGQMLGLVSGKSDTFHAFTPFRHCHMKKRIGTKLEPNWNQIGTKLEPNWNQIGTKLEHEMWSIFEDQFLRPPGPPARFHLEAPHRP